MKTDQGVLAVLAIGAATIIIVIRMMVNARVWKRLIEHNVFQEKVALPDVSLLEPDRFSWLKWGIVLFSLGLGLVILYSIPTTLGDEVLMGMLSLFVGAGFIASYIVTTKITEKDQGSTG
jgi:hypothetical protein